ncbi:hypothetical protein K3495_g10720 [Podosphaera aphanis]|nr:hypothetical protein K3495_g10720 [Podosphaera aphanis]
MSSLSQPKPSEVAEYKGDGASRWLKSNWSARIGYGWSQQTVSCGTFIDFLDAHMAQNSPVAHFFDGSKEFQKIIYKDQNLLVDVRRHDGSSSKGPTGLMYAAKRSYDDASLSLSAGINLTAKSSRRLEDALRQQATRASAAQGVNATPLGNQQGLENGRGINSNSVQFDFGINSFVHRPPDGQTLNTLPSQNLQHYPLSPQSNFAVNIPSNDNASNALDNFAHHQVPPPAQLLEDRNQLSGPYIHLSRRALVMSEYGSGNSSDSQDPPTKNSVTKFFKEQLSVEELFVRKTEVEVSNHCTAAQDIHTVWFEQDETSESEEYIIAALAAEAKNMRDSTDTEETRTIGKKVASFKPARKKRSPQGIQENNEEIRPANSKESPPSLEAAPPSCVQFSQDQRVGRSSKHQAHQLSPCQPLLPHQDQDSDQAVQLPTPQISAPKSSATRPSVTQISTTKKSLPHISHQPDKNYGIADPSIPIPSRSCAIPQLSGPPDEHPFEGFRSNQPQLFHNSHNLPRERHPDNIGNNELAHRKSPTLKVKRDARALTKLAAINGTGKKGMICWIILR